jgi:hypothetical protein
MRKKRNNKSSRFADWTTPYLKKYASALEDCVHGANPCFGARDLLNLQGAGIELEKRGYGRRSLTTYRKV